MLQKTQNQQLRKTYWKSQIMVYR